VEKAVGMIAREEILDRVQTALGPDPDIPEIPRDYVVATTLDRIGLVERFAERAAEYRATVWRCSAEDVHQAVGAALAEHGARRLVAPDGLPEAWRPEGIEWMLDGERQLAVEELDGADGVVTGCALAIADTGTIVLDAGERQGRRALTLLPDLHVCVVQSSQVVGTVPEAIRALGNAVRTGRRPVTFISGPSATSDIELNRVEGVHGPRRLEIILASR
jgi:L-lactate dehydrogenase complex protein LldG